MEYHQNLVWEKFIEYKEMDDETYSATVASYLPKRGLEIGKVKNEEEALEIAGRQPRRLTAQYEIFYDSEVGTFMETSKNEEYETDKESDHEENRGEESEKAEEENKRRYEISRWSTYYDEEANRFEDSLYKELLERELDEYKENRYNKELNYFEFKLVKGIDSRGKVDLIMKEFISNEVIKEYIWDGKIKNFIWDGKTTRAGPKTIEFYQLPKEVENYVAATANTFHLDVVRITEGEESRIIIFRNSEDIKGWDLGEGSDDKEIELSLRMERNKIMDNWSDWITYKGVSKFKEHDSQFRRLKRKYMPEQEYTSGSWDEPLYKEKEKSMEPWFPRKEGETSRETKEKRKEKRKTEDAKMKEAKYLEEAKKQKKTIGSKHIILRLFHQIQDAIDKFPDVNKNTIAKNRKRKIFLPENKKRYSRPRKVEKKE